MILFTEQRGNVLTLWLNRPDVRNALNEQLIAGLTEAFLQLPAGIRVVVIRGRGKAFCAGADLEYMQRLAGFSEAENLADARRLGALFDAVAQAPVPVIAVVHGAVMGGANGLLAAADIVLAETSTRFAFSEVRLGIVPAVISPYILRRMNTQPARELMLTGRFFAAGEARDGGLVNAVLPEDEIEKRLAQYIDDFLAASPDAVTRCKKLLDHVEKNLSDDQLSDYTARAIAGARASAEGREGLAAFLEKRKPDWTR